MRRLQPTTGIQNVEGQSDLRSHAFISIVVPVRNEQPHIQRTLEMLLVQDYPRDCFEIIVVDGQSNDATREIVSRISRECHNVRLINNPRQWSSAGRNLGVQNALGDLILIVDGHCALKSRSHLSDIAVAFETSGADIIGRPQPLEAPLATALQRAVAEARASRLGHHPDSFIYTETDRFVPAISVGAAYRREVFLRIGYFDESFDACEDVDFNYRADQARLSCFFSSRAVVNYVPRKSLPKLFRQLARYGRGRFRLWRKHPETLSLKTLLPGVFVTGLLAGPLLPFVNQPLWWAYWVCLLIYLSILLTVSVSIGIRRRDWKLMMWLPVVFLTIHVSAGCGILQETLFSGSGNAWPSFYSVKGKSNASKRSDLG